MTFTIIQDRADASQNLTPTLGISPQSAFAAGHGLTLLIDVNLAGGITSVTSSNADTWVRLVQALNTTAGNPLASEIWYCASSAGGSPTITINGSGTSSVTKWDLTEWSGSFASAGDTAANNALTNTWSLGAVTAAAGDLSLFTMANNDGILSGAPPAGFTALLGNGSVGYVGNIEFGFLNSAATTTGSGTVNGTNGWSAVAGVLKAAAGPPPPTAPQVIGSSAGYGSTSLPTPVGTLPGDLILFHAYVRGTQTGTGTPAGPPGFELVDGWPITAAGADADHTVTHYCWYSYAVNGSIYPLTWKPAGFPTFAAQLIVIRGGPTSGIPFAQDDPQSAVPDGTTAFPSCVLTTTDADDLLLYLASDANDGDITTGVTMSDSGHTWTSLTWHSIGGFATTQAGAGTTGTVHGVGVATGSFAKTAALIAVSTTTVGSGIFLAGTASWIPLNTYFSLNGAWV